MKIKFLPFKEQQRKAGMGNSVFGLDESIIPYTHIQLSSMTDYTLCGQATDEYLFRVLSKDSKITCTKCIEVAKECKEVTL